VIQWWCSATNGPWTWRFVPYPGVWIVTGLLALTYWRLTRGVVAPRRDLVLGWVGLAIFYVSIEWPIGPLAAGYLASAHALQFLLGVLIAPPLILIGARHGIEARWPRGGAWERRLRVLLSPLLAAIVFNIVIITTHVPRVNDALLVSQLGVFLLDLSWLAAGLYFWWPIVVPVPARPLFAVPFQMLYLFLGTIAHTGIAIVMLITQHPMYAVYELAPRATALSAQADIKVAGGIMELGGAAIIFGVLSAMFFRWSGGTGAEPRHSAPSEGDAKPAL
jgi:cytochrome c oxidase assembly factor CtaG